MQIIKSGALWAHEHMIRNEENQPGTTLLHSHTYFGYAYGGTIQITSPEETRVIKKGDFFCMYVSKSLQFKHTRGSTAKISVAGKALLLSANAYKGHTFMCGSVDMSQGHVKYIDNCTDSLLICPPRLGDPCLNALYFPTHIDQSYHTHPSFRAGIIAQGSGVACFGEPNEEQIVPLNEGDIFYLPPEMRHRFRTEDKEMVVIAYHPDSDWGPTDELHPMINRTIL